MWNFYFKISEQGPPEVRACSDDEKDEGLLWTLESFEHPNIMAMPNHAALQDEMASAAINAEEAWFVDLFEHPGYQSQCLSDGFVHAFNMDIFSSPRLELERKYRNLNEGDSAIVVAAQVATLLLNVVRSRFYKLNDSAPLDLTQMWHEHHLALVGCGFKSSCSSMFQLPYVTQDGTGAMVNALSSHLKFMVRSQIDPWIVKLDMRTYDLEEGQPCPVW